MRFKTLLLTVLACGLVSMCPVAAANAKTYHDCSIALKTALVLGSIVATPVYVACKLPLAAAGAAVSAPVNFVSMKYAAGFAEPLALHTMTGDWYITPSVLHGDRKLQYFGPVD